MRKGLQNRISPSNLENKILLVFTICLFTFVSAFGQPIFSIVGNGTTFNTSTGYPAPYGNYWWGARHQFYVTPAELAAAGVSAGGQINSIGFNVISKNTSTNPHLAWTVTIYTTTSANPIAGGYITTGVVSTSTVTNVTPVLGWNQTPVAPFVWNGTDGIVIETCFQNSSFQQNHSHEWTTNLSGATFSIWRNADAAGQCTMPNTSSSTNTRPNIRFEWEFLTPCSGVPYSNSVLTPTYQVCANQPVGSIGFASSYTLSGLTYQWMSSTVSNVGPFSPVSGATSWAYSVPGLTATTYYQAVITCTNGNQSFTTAGSPVIVAGTTTNNVPYYEDFEGIGANNRLPNCSWLAANLGGTVKTYTSSQTNNRIANSGTSFAAFELPSSNNTMYTNGIWMVPGVTYSAAAHFATEYFGYSNWSNLSLLVGPNQNTTGQQLVATAAPAISGAYKVIGNTFQVSSPGFYYVAIRASGSPGSALYLMIDDVSVTVPCTVSSGNLPTVNVTATSGTVCLGDQVSFFAVGADTWLWNTGATTSSLTLTPPLGNNSYTVVGTSSLTGCPQTVVQQVIVNPSPTVFIVVSKPEICPGETVYLTAYGADNYAWSNSGAGATIGVSPNTTGIFSVLGSNTLGCANSASAQVVVKPLPQVAVVSNDPDLMSCIGDQVVLTGSGAANYEWYSSSNGVLMQGSPVSIILTTTSTFTVVGTGSNGCSAKATITQNVSECVGLKESKGIAGLNIYPNPTQAFFTIDGGGSIMSMVTITDVSGRIVMNSNQHAEKLRVDLSGFSSGVYFATIITDGGTEVVRIIKN